MPDKLEGGKIELTHHKVEVVSEAPSELWFNKSCSSNRVATSFLFPEKKKGKKVQWKVYLGGGAVDAEQTELLHGAVVLTKDWFWAALTIVAAWILTCCCPCGEPSFVDEDLLFTETTSEPLEDDAERDPVHVDEKRPLGLDMEQRAKFATLCASCWDQISSHPAFKDWPMGRPGEPLEDEATRAGKARQCAMQFACFRAGA